jgi:hypothetical protein
MVGRACLDLRLRDIAENQFQNAAGDALHSLDAQLGLAVSQVRRGDHAAAPGRRSTTRWRTSNAKTRSGWRAYLDAGAPIGHRDEIKRYCAKPT